jgi:hypothetical protein
MVLWLLGGPLERPIQSRLLRLRTKYQSHNAAQPRASGRCENTGGGITKVYLRKTCPKLGAADFLYTFQRLRELYAVQATLGNRRVG